MKFKLTKNRIEYVLYHLNFFLDLSEIRQDFVFINEYDEIRKHHKKIIFYISQKNIDELNIKYYKNIPILFPGKASKEIYFRNNGNIIFYDDLISSCFFLLSGYQEFKNSDLDKKGRFKFHNSIQSKLNIIQKPVVNYYFQFILEGISAFCFLYKKQFVTRTVFTNFAFMLTHDIDRIDKYNIHRVKRLAKQIINKPKLETINDLFYSSIQLLKSNTRKNPYWNFDYLLSLENKYEITATYFFLHKDTKHFDSYYDFDEERIKKVIRKILKKDHEIGLHGTLDCSFNQDKIQLFKKKLEKITGRPVYGIRQHWLKFLLPDTAILQQKSRLLYDTSLGFAEHEGFRNSFCHPFKLYDFDRDEMLDIWEIPLTVMDRSLFDYRNLGKCSVIKSLNELLNEIIKFNGVLSLLWHNSSLDENEFKGIEKFYEYILETIINHDPENLTGNQIINRYIEIYAE